MNKSLFTLRAVALLIFTLAIATAAQAQATRTWVSGVGDDVNPCSRTAPCKTYAGAISKTARDGEISTLDPGGFGAVTITKSITINGGGGGQGYGSILAALTNGIVINITDAADVRKSVRLNWLDINGASSGLDGIRFLNGNSLVIENSNIDGFTGDGIEANFTTGTITRMFLKNVSIRNCVGDGLKLTSTSAVIVASLDNVQAVRCGNGVSLASNTRLIAHNSTFTANTSAGVVQSGSNTETTLFHCSLNGNQTGISVSGGTVRISDNMIYGNVTGVTGNVRSWGNNYIDGNGSNGLPVAPNLTQL
jgi:hypothetical protein